MGITMPAFVYSVNVFAQIKIQPSRNFILVQ